VRALIINPLVLALSGALGVMLCRALQVNPQLHQLMLAGVICLLAAETGTVFLLFHRALPMHPAQAGLLATMLHLMLATLLGGGVLVFMHPPMAFVLWLLVFYWLTLIAVAAAAVRVARQPSVAAGPAAK
jgi:hypothetical protein